MMKKYFGLLVCIALFAACDDGDLTFESIDFDNVAAARCANKLYKLNEKEALIVNIGSTDENFNFALREEPTGSATPLLLDLVSNNIDVVYRLYNGEVGSESICASIPPLNPTAIEDWTATSGNLQVTTTANLVENTTPGFEGGQKISGYRHNIILTNVEFAKSSGTTQLYPTFNFGTYDKPITRALPVQFDDVLDICDPSYTLIYNTAGTHAVTLKIDPALLDHSIMDSPRTATIDGTSNIFSYNIFDVGPISGPTHFCTSTPTSNPIEVWNGTGTLEITTTASGSGYLHTIVLKNVTLSRGNSQFLLATSYLMGTLLTDF